MKKQQLLIVATMRVSNTIAQLSDVQLVDNIHDLGVIKQVIEILR